VKPSLILPAIASLSGANHSCIVIP